MPHLMPCTLQIHVKSLSRLALIDSTTTRDYLASAPSVKILAGGSWKKNTAISRMMPRSEQQPVFFQKRTDTSLVTDIWFAPINYLCVISCVSLSYLPLELTSTPRAQSLACFQLSTIVCLYRILSCLVVTDYSNVTIDLCSKLLV